MSRKSLKKKRRQNQRTKPSAKYQSDRQVKNELPIIKRIGPMTIIIGIVATVVLGLAGILASHGHRALSIWTFYIACVLYAFIGFKVWDDSGKKRASTTDDLSVITPGSKPRPKTHQSVPDDKFLLILGDFLAWKSDLPMVALMQRDEPLIRLNKEPHGMSLSAKFFSADGKIVAEIDRNEIHPNPANFWRIKRSAHRLIVFNDEAKVVMDVQYLNPRTVKILGKFFARGGYPIELAEDGISLGSGRFVKTAAGEFGNAAIHVE